MLPRAAFAALLLPAVAAAAGAEEPPAPPPLAEARGDLDRDGRPERVRLERDGTLRVTDDSGAERLRVKLPLPTVPEAADLALTTVEGHPTAHARARFAGGRAVEAVVTLDGGARALAIERTGPLGDGDRGLHLRVRGDGLVRYQTSPTVVRCDGDELLFPERWDFSQARFRPVIDPPPAGTPLLATSVAPADLPDAPLGVYHFVAASTAADAERRADRLASPVELADGRRETLWVAGPPGGGRGAWVAARAEAPGHFLRALRVQPGPGPAPRALTLLADGDVRFSVPLPGGSGPFYVVPPAPIPTSCVAIVIAEPPPAEGSPGTTLAEVSIYSELDRGGGIDDLVALVAEARPGADAAARVLQAQGARAVEPIARKLPTAPPGAGRRRLVEALAALGAPEAAPALARALETAAAAERAPLVDGLARLAARGGAEAARLYADAGQSAETRADAARVLGRVAAGGDGAALAALVDGAGAGPAAARRETVEALARAAAASPDAVRALIAALDREAAPVADSPAGKVSPAGKTFGAPRLGDLARALGGGARSSPLRAEAASALARALGGAPDFENRLRVIRAMGDLGDPSLAAPLAAAASGRDETLRWAAVEAAAALDGDAGRALLGAALADADPRVRRAALTHLGTRADAETARALGDALARDPWPLVRRAAAEGLQSACARAPDAALGELLGRAVAGDGASPGHGGDRARGPDPSEEVRRAALAALARCAPSSPAIGRALGDRAQPLSVRELAAALIAAHAAPGAAAALAAALDGVLTDPAADERSVGLAVACLRGLARAGDTSDPILETIGNASREPLSGAVRAAAMETIGRLCPTGSAPTLRRGAEDPDPAVRRAADAALAACHR